MTIRNIVSKIFLYASIQFIFITTIQAQTTIDDVQEGSYLQIGIEANSRPVFAGQDLGINGLEILPAITYQHKNGLYASISTTTYTSPAILKKTKIAEINTTLGYQVNSGMYTGDFSISNSQVQFGNKFFRRFLVNTISAQNSFDITDNLELQANVMFLFGAKIKTNNATVLEGNAQYHFYINEVLGAEQLSISPSISYFYGSDKLVNTFGDRDTLSEKNKKVDVSNAMQTLSIVPNIECGWQKGHHELTVAMALPFANTITTNLPLVTTTAISANQPLFTIRYSLYIGGGNKD